MKAIIFCNQDHSYHFSSGEMHFIFSGSFSDLPMLLILQAIFSMFRINILTFLQVLGKHKPN